MAAQPAFSSCQRPPQEGCPLPRQGVERAEVPSWPRPAVVESRHKGTTGRGWGKEQESFHKEGWAEFKEENDSTWHTATSTS